MKYLSIQKMEIIKNNVLSLVKKNTDSLEINLIEEDLSNKTFEIEFSIFDNNFLQEYVVYENKRIDNHYIWHTYTLDEEDKKKYIKMIICLIKADYVPTEDLPDAVLKNLASEILKEYMDFIEKKLIEHVRATKEIIDKEEINNEI
jgi:hypothetical protein